MGHRFLARWVLVLCLLSIATVPTMAQGTITDFGQNRVQYKNFQWSFFESEHFLTYFYLGGQDIGKYAIIYSEKVLPEIEKAMEFKINRRIDVLIYNDLSDLNQTNIGTGTELNNTGGLTRIIDNRLFIYYDGNHQHLEKQIRQGIAQVMLSHMLFGTNVQEVLQNAVMLNLPNWFSYGFASYIGESWNTDMDDRLRDGILSGKYKKFNKLKGEEAQFAGHAFWHYVEERYGKTAVPNLLYLTRINRSLESGFLFVLGGSVKNVLDEWYTTQKSRYTSQMDGRQNLAAENKVDKKVKGNKHLYQAKISEDGKHLGFVTNILGKYKVYVNDIEANKQRRILKGGHKTTTLVTDYSYPLLAWSPDKKTLAVIYNRRDKLKLLLYDVEATKKTKANITKFQQIHDFRFTNDPNLLVMSAVNMGQSDIYSYQLSSTTVDQLTNDYYDDLDVEYINVKGRSGIIFSSNRPDISLKPLRLDTTLLTHDFDIYFLNTKNRTELTQVTNTPLTNERSPLQYDSNNVAWLTDATGISNYVGGPFKRVSTGFDTVVFFVDSVVTNPKWDLEALRNTPNNGIDSINVVEKFKDIVTAKPLSDFAATVMEVDISHQSGKALHIFREAGREELYLYPLSNPSSTSLNPNKSDYRLYVEKQAEKEIKKQTKPQEQLGQEIVLVLDDDTLTPVPIDTVPPKPYFQSDFNVAPEINVAQFIGNIHGAGDTLGGRVSIFQVTKVLPYRPKFSTDYIVTQIDNSLIMTRYEKFRPGVPVFGNPPLGAMINLGISDLMEDYRIFGGFRLPFDLQGSEYFIAYENLRRRLDKRFTYYRRVQKESFSNDDILPFVNNSANGLAATNPNIAVRNPNLPIEAKLKTNYLEMRLKYSLDVLRSIRGYMAFRNDNYVYQANEEFTLELPNYSENWVFARLEYIMDNTIKVATNISNGVKFKVWGEMHTKFTFEKDTIFNNLKLTLPNFDGTFLGVVGMDFRYYQKIHRELTWANRIAVGSSFGTRKLIYYLGGVDSWIAPGFNNNIGINTDNNYAFQTIVTNMRGFDQNIRNGNSYAVLNSEIRWPIFTHLLNTNIRSQFIRDFMLIGFTDVGSAWEGFNPYNSDNPLFTDQITNGSVTVNVKYFRNPVVVGYGFGLRSTLFGYYMRFDVAWGNDSGAVTGPKFYFSLTTDF
ncbi:MAG: hypothetical protein SFW35_11555 [Chitinophagales bacterium]|nr:hypothetical protein [Chitinophagales bacterium]